MAGYVGIVTNVRVVKVGNLLRRRGIEGLRAELDSDVIAHDRG